MTERVRTDSAPPATEDLNPYNIAQQQFDHAAEYVADLPAGLRNLLRATQRLLKVEFPIECDDGTVRMFSGYRAFDFDGDGLDDLVYPWPSAGIGLVHNESR